MLLIGKIKSANIGPGITGLADLAVGETKGEGSQVQGLVGLQNEFKFSLGNLVRVCLKIEA